MGSVDLTDVLNETSLTDVLNETSWFTTSSLPRCEGLNSPKRTKVGTRTKTRWGQCGQLSTDRLFAYSLGHGPVGHNRLKSGLTSVYTFGLGLFGSDWVESS